MKTAANAGLLRAALLGASLLRVMPARADVTLLFEQPMGSFWSGNPAHTAIYLSRVCAESPLVLRRCAPREAGAVISRYHRIDGDDWVAIPLIPYLYSVQHAAQVPSSSSREEAASLREAYRESHLMGIAPDAARSGAERSRDWPQTVGEAYDRTLYAYKLPTTEAQDEAFIRTFNTRPNRNQFNIVFRNCANFAAQVIDFYYPGAVSRSARTLGIMTPKQVAQAFVGYSRRHPKLAFSVFEIAQVPGTVPRSKPVRGVWSTKYLSGAACKVLGGDPDPGVRLPTLTCPEGKDHAGASHAAAAAPPASRALRRCSTCSSVRRAS